MADHMIEVLTWLEPQGVTGLVGVDDNLCVKEMPVRDWKVLRQWQEAATDSYISLIITCNYYLYVIINDTVLMEVKE